MFQNIPVILGQYRPLDSYLHRLDARAKLVPVLLVLILSLLTDSLLFYMVILASLITGLLLSKIEPKTLLRNFKPILILVVITSLYHLIFTTSKANPIFTVWGWSLTEGAVKSAVFYSLRLVIFISIAFLITLTNSPSQLGEAFTKLLRPLEKIKIPVGELALILFIALRFIPILYEEFVDIKNAQMIRGVNFGGSLIQRIKKTSAVIIPVFVAALNRADDLALALQARGYESGGKRTFYSSASFGVNDTLFGLLSSIIIVGLFYWLG